VDGELIHATGSAEAYYFSGIEEGYLILNAETPNWNWALVVENYEGAFSCGVATFVLIHKETEASRMSGVDVEPCSASIDQAAPLFGDVIAGSFSGRIRTTNPQDPWATVTNGTFRLQRREDGLEMP
jgi:hypothetical protein